MKFALILVAVLGVARADSYDGLQWFLGCCRKAMLYGVPSIPVPVHNPLHIRDITYLYEKLLVKADFNVTNNILYNLVNLSWPILEVFDRTEPIRNSVNYMLNWPVLNLTGEFSVKYKAGILPAVTYKGTYNVVLHDVNWWGVFDFVQPGQEGVKMQVDQFTLSSNVKNVDVHLTGFVGTLPIEVAIKEGVTLLFNHFPESAAEFLRTKRFNEFWADHPERIKAVFDWCSEN